MPDTLARGVVAEVYTCPGSSSASDLEYLEEHQGYYFPLSPSEGVKD
jgi:hypothetical protein